MYNGHADVTALLDTSGNIVGSYYYDAFGNITESSGSMKDKNSILYAGYQYDSETELYYLNARMYDPKIARFLQEDTYLGNPNDPLSLNLYTYCANNPLMYYDPTGHNGENIFVQFWNWLTGNGKEEKKEEPEEKPKGGGWDSWATEEQMDRWNFLEMTPEEKAKSREEAKEEYEELWDEALIKPAKQVASVGVGFTPADAVKDTADFIEGKDTFTDEPMNRWVMAGMIILPEEGDQFLRQFAKKSSKAATENGLEELVEAGVKQVKFGEHFTRQGRKKVLKPNVKYVTKEGYEYVTDSNGRIISATGNLQIGTGKRKLYSQRNVGKPDYRLSTDNGGHLIGSQFKGSGYIDNLVPMDSQINKAGGKWYNMEKEWSEALRANKSVKVRIEPLYSGSSLRPDSFEIEYVIGNGKPKVVTIKNQAGG